MTYGMARLFDEGSGVVISECVSELESGGFTLSSSKGLYSGREHTVVIPIQSLKHLLEWQRKENCQHTQQGRK